MKKFLLLAAVAAMLGTGAAQAEITYELTKQWSNENITISAVSAWGGSARQAVGQNGVVYVQDNVLQNLTGYNASGAVEGKQFSTCNAWSVNHDEAGNILVIYGAGATGALRTDTIQMVLISADGNTIKRIAAPANCPAARFDYIGKIAGNIFGESATLLVAPQAQTTLTAFMFANGECTGVKQVATSGDALPTFATQSIVSYGWYDEANDEEHYLCAERTYGYADVALSYGDDGTPSGAKVTSITFVTEANKKQPANAGADMFQLGNNIYISAGAIEKDFNYRNPISIYTLVDGKATPVVTSDVVYDTEKIKGAGNFTTAEVLGSNSANIYQYYTGNFVAEFTFKVNDPSAVSDVNASKTVAGVHYVNLAGQVSATPFDGMNIKVTNYTDGSQKATKVIK